MFAVQKTLFPVRPLLALAVLAMTGSAFATVSTDTDFSAVAATLVAWTQGTLGGVLKIGSLLIGMALAIKTQRLPIPVSVTLVTYFVPETVDTIFGAVI